MRPSAFGLPFHGLDASICNPRLANETPGQQCVVAWSQGIELENPNARQEMDSQRAGTESYFSEYSGFRSLKKPPGAPK